MSRSTAPLPQLQDIDLRLLRVFVCIARSGGFAAAQTELNIGQSTISSYISMLETRLGVVLCHRGRKGFRLTDVGASVAEAAGTLFRDIDQFRDRVVQAKDELPSDYKIGLVDAVANLNGDMVPALLGRFCKKTPQIRLDLRLGQPGALVSDLLNGGLDAAVVPIFRPLSGVTALSLDKVDPQSLYCGKDHPFFSRSGQIPTHEIAAAPFVHRKHMEGWSPYTSKSLNTMATTMDIECQLILVLTGNFICYLPDRYAVEWVNQGLLKRIPTEDFGYFSDICLCVRADDTSIATNLLLAAASGLLKEREPVREFA